MDTTITNKEKTRQYFKYLQTELKRNDVHTCLIPIAYLQSSESDDHTNDYTVDHTENYAGDYADDHVKSIDSVSDVKETNIGFLKENSSNDDMCYDYGIPIPARKMGEIHDWIYGTNRHSSKYNSFKYLEKEHSSKKHNSNSENDSKSDDENDSKSDDDNDSKSDDDNSDNEIENVKNIKVKQLFTANEIRSKIQITKKTNLVVHNILPVVIEFCCMDERILYDWLLKKKNIDIQHMKKIRKIPRRGSYLAGVKNICEVYKSLDDCIELIYEFAHDRTIENPEFSISYVTAVYIYYIGIKDNKIIVVADMPGSACECDTCTFSLQYNEKINAWCDMGGDFENGDFSIVVMDLLLPMK